MNWIAAVALILTFATDAYAQCAGGKSSGGTEYRYCIDYGTGNDILYFMHGGGGSEESWSKQGWIDELDSVWQKDRYARPIVISISFGPQWLLADVASSLQPAYLQIVTDEIIPKLEKQIGGLKGKRLLMGNSMGGFNSAELSLRAPNLFDRVALLCPGLRVVNPFLSDAEIDALIKTLPASTDAEYVKGIVGWVRQVYGTEAVWNRHDPQLLAENAIRLKPSYFVSCSKDDEYGFYAPAKAIAETLAKKTKTQWVSIESGGHCAQTAESWTATAKFLEGK